MLRIKRQRADVSRSGVDQMERGGARARVSLGLSPCNKFVPMVNGVCSSKYYRYYRITVLHGFANSAFREMVPSTRSWAGGSEGSEIAPNPFTEWVEFIRIIFLREFPYLGPADVSNASNELLAIAWINLHAAKGRCVELRVLLDQESTFSFISKLFCQTLQTTRQSPISKYIDLEKIIPIIRNQRLC